MAHKIENKSDESVAFSQLIKYHLFKVLGCIAGLLTIGFSAGCLITTIQKNIELNDLKIAHQKEITEVKIKYQDDLSKERQKAASELVKVMIDMQTAKTHEK